MQFDMSVSAPLVFEQAAAEGAPEGQFVAVDLLVSLQVTEAAAGGQGDRGQFYILHEQN